jgi:phage tail sheath gpL-like
MDFDTDHGYKKPPAWHLWQLQKLGFKGHADVYMGVFWNNKRRRINATYPYATVVYSGTPVAGDVVSVSIGGTTVSHAIGYGETLQGIVSDMRAIINGLFSGVWADDNFGSSTTLRIQSKAPSWTYTGVAVSAPNSVTLTLTDHLGTAGTDGDWEMIDAVSPVMTEGARKWIRDLAGQFQAAGIKASFAFSMECYLPPTAMRA